MKFYHLWDWKCLVAAVPHPLEIVCWWPTLMSTGIELGIGPGLTAQPTEPRPAFVCKGSLAPRSEPLCMAMLLCPVSSASVPHKGLLYEPEQGGKLGLRASRFLPA